MSTEASGPGHEELRARITSHLLARMDALTAEAVALFPYGGDLSLGADYCRQVGYVLLQLLALGVRDGRIDSRGRLIVDLYRLALERNLPVAQLCTFAYLAERTALDELALADGLGATTESWTQVSQLARRASFDMLAAYSERAQREPGGAALSDGLTTLYSRATLDAVLEKELERATRLGYPVSLILFDIDHLSAINQEHGYGVGDRILERVGILIRKYFRQQDWVARYGGDVFAVLLTYADGTDVSTLAERVRSTVEQRLGFVDHRDDRPVVVTLSAGVLNLNIAAGESFDPESVRSAAERALEAAKRAGRNRVERLDGMTARDQGEVAAQPPSSAQ